MFSHHQVNPCQQGSGRKRGGRFYAKLAAETHYRLAERAYLQEKSLAHPIQKTTEAQPQGDHVKNSLRYRLRPPRGGRIRQDLRKEREEI